MRPLRVRTVALAVFLAVALAPPARAADPIMPLDQVHAGMHCTGLSVVRGVDIASFDVEVIDVVAGQPPEDPRILVRVSGPAIEGTGIAEGFSGSPVYCTGADGVKRNIGGISETVGQYGETVGLVTPIEQMLGVPSDPPVNPRYAPALLRRAKPLTGVLTVSGVSPRLGRALQGAARRSNRTFLAVPPGPLGTYAPQNLVPGSSLTAGYATGDIGLGAIGTTTYTDGDLVYGFGHPFDAVGRRALLLEDAYVYTVIGNPLDIDMATSYKYAAPGHALGTLSDDAPNGVVGHVGTLPETTAVTVNATDADNGNQRTLTAQAVDEASVGFPTGTSPLISVAELGLLQQATTIIGGTPARESGDMCMRVVLAVDDTPLRFCNRYVVQGAGDTGDQLGPLAPLAADDLDTGLGLISTAQFADLGVRSLDVSLKLSRGLAFGEIQSARATSSSVRRGGKLGVALTVRILRGPLRKVSFSVPVPSGLKPGRHELHLKGPALDDPAVGASEVVLQVASGGDPSATDTGTSTPAGPTSLADLQAQFDGIARYDGIAGAFTGGSGRFAAYRDPKLRIGGSGSVAFKVR